MPDLDNIKVGNEPCPKCFAAHPSTIDCSITFAPIEPVPKPIMPDDLIERLLRKEQYFPATGGGGVGIDASGKAVVTSYITDDGYRLVNPDGPEAASEIERLREENRVLLEDRDRQRAALTGAVAVLARYREETPLGHQPHMIAHVADIALEEARASLTASRGGDRNE